MACTARRRRGRPRAFLSRDELAEVLVMRVRRTPWKVILAWFGVRSRTAAYVSLREFTNTLPLEVQRAGGDARRR